MDKLKVNKDYFLITELRWPISLAALVEIPRCTYIRIYYRLSRPFRLEEEIINYCLLSIRTL